MSTHDQGTQGIEPTAPQAASPGWAARLAWALPLACIPYLALTLRFAFVCDDAYISFRYARNLATGAGLVYNPGVSPPVEGYSEFLWVLLLAPFQALGLRPELPAMLLGGLAGLCLVALATVFLARRIAPGPMALAGGALLLGCTPPLAVWSTGGMGTMPFALCIFVLYERLFGSRDEHHGWQAALAASLVVLLRADGALFVFLLGGLALAIGALRRDRCLLRAALTASGVAALVFAAHVAWRLGYYGDWLPNTARAKIGGSALALERGSKYVAHFFLTMPGLALAALAPLAFGRRCFERPTLAALAGVLGSLAYGVWAGGDFMAFGRFLVPCLPLVVVLFTKALAALEEDGRGAIAVGLALVCTAGTLSPAFGLHVLPESLRVRAFFRFNAMLADGKPFFRSELEQWGDMRDRAQEWLQLGRALALHTDPEDSLVAGAIGALGFESDRFLFDQFGLVTREVALRPADGVRRSPGHDKAVGPAFFDRSRPTYSWMKLLAEGEQVDVRRLRVPPAQVRVVELDPARGFAPGTRLILEPPPRQ